MNLWVAFWVLAVFVIYGAIIYNRITALALERSNSEADIDMQSKLRDELIRSSAAKEEIAAIEGKIAAARKFFDSTTAEYNMVIQKFPGVIVARMFGLKPV